MSCSFWKNMQQGNNFSLMAYAPVLKKLSLYNAMFAIYLLKSAWQLVTKFFGLIKCWLSCDLTTSTILTFAKGGWLFIWRLHQINHLTFYVWDEVVSTLGCHQLSCCNCDDPPNLRAPLHFICMRRNASIILAIEAFLRACTGTGNWQHQGCPAQCWSLVQYISIINEQQNG